MIYSKRLQRILTQLNLTFNIMETKIIQIQDVTVEELAEAISEKLMTKVKLFLNQVEESKDHDTYLTREEAAQYFSISLGTLWSWTKKEMLKSC
jgi:transcriptional regulator with XRE-family HTH domain